MSPYKITWLQVVAALFIVATVAAILFPVFTAGHNCARCNDNCLSNEKQVGLGLLQYVQDYNEALPPLSDEGGRVTWRTDILPYTKAPALFQCPDRDLSDHAANPTGADGFAQSYAANDAGDYGPGQHVHVRGAFAGPGAKARSPEDVYEPSQLITLMEVSHNPFPGYNINDAVTNPPNSKRFWAGHQGFSNYLFLDGHAKALRPLDSRPFWYSNPGTPLSANGIAVLRDAQARFPS